MPARNERIGRRINARWSGAIACLSAVWFSGFAASRAVADTAVDFNRDIRPILSNNCFLCHGPDEAERKAGLRLDVRDEATADNDGVTALVPGDPEASDLFWRLTAEDDSERMPPPESGKSLTRDEIALVERWIREGAPYATHWSYVKPARPTLPETGGAPAGWPRNPIDRFVLAGLEAEGLEPAPEAERAILARRAALDVTGLPPTPEEVADLIADGEPDAFERYVDRLLAKPAYGEHWARMWLDLARYADSAGYADDPPRTIWGYRDWVIRAFNRNLPFDRFTIEQLAGDLLPEPTRDQLIATAFHRNTQTNNEGGTSDEEFRNVAIVDRVNTTMSVWMGTTMACAQCHTHKYDPISQKDYFRMFAIFNQSEDADRRDESPFIDVIGDAQQRQRKAWQDEIAGIEAELLRDSPAIEQGRRAWEAQLTAPRSWQPMTVASAEAESGADLRVLGDGSVLASGPGADKDVYSVSVEAPEAAVSALRIEVLPHESLPGGGPGRSEGGGNFVLTGVTAAHLGAEEHRTEGRFVRISLAGAGRILSLAEVQVFDGAENVAVAGSARQSTTDFNGPPGLAIDGNTDGNFRAGSTTHTAISDDPWWEVDLGSVRPIDRIAVWNRMDGGDAIAGRLAGFHIQVLDGERRPVFEAAPEDVPKPSGEYALGGARPLVFAAAHADHSQEGFEAAFAVGNPMPDEKGWAVGGALGTSHELILPLAQPVALDGGAVEIRLAHLSKHAGHTIGRFRISFTTDAIDPLAASAPADVRTIAGIPDGQRSDAQRRRIAEHYQSVAPELAAQRARLEELRRNLAEMKPETTVPVMRELSADRQRKTHVQLRGNFLDLGDEVTAGLPEAFVPPGDDQHLADRMDLARWLVSPENPLTARVTVNRYWEKLFGSGLVLTSEEFGSQGEPPSHPELLDWLAVEFIESGWDMKRLVKLIVTSAAYRQSSKVTPERLEKDPANRLISRGPRFRLPAEAIRDQALAVAGLLSGEMFGEPVRPPQPSLGLSAAFGGGIDWTTSEGADRYRRGIYTTWRRSSPYPSMITFDAPNREVCTVRRDRTNTPLQALVTLNDPVYIEAAQALGRRMAAAGGDVPAGIRHGFELCLVRPPTRAEVGALAELFDDTFDAFRGDAAGATAMATDPLGPLPEGADPAEFAAWTVVANVLMNLDEFLMRP